MQASDLGSSFLLDRTSLGQNRAQASAPFLRDMNPRVTITADPRSLDAIPSLDAIVSIYDLVIATDLGYTALLAVSGSARRCGKPFYAAASVGSFGWAFADLLEHDFTVERTVSNVASTAGRRESPTRIILATKLEQGAGSSNGSSSTAPAKETVTKREVYSPFAAAAFAPLPASEATPRRKLRVSPLLSCVRALWFYQSTRSPLQPYPRILSHNVTAPATNGTTTTADGHPLMQNIHPGNPDCELFLHLAQQHHASLGLPAHTLTTDKVADFLNCCGTELAPVCAVVGGHVAQDAINMLGGKEQPLQNLFVFDADDTVGQVLAMHPAEGPVGTRLELGGQVRGHQRGESGGSRGNGRVVVKMEVKRESEDR